MQLVVRTSAAVRCPATPAEEDNSASVAIKPPPCRRIGDGTGAPRAGERPI